MNQDDRVLDQSNTEKLKQVTDLINKLRLVGLSEVDTLVAAEAEALDRDFAFELERFGEDSPRAEKLKNQALAQRMLQVRLQAAAQRAAVAVPKAKPDFHIIHGRAVKREGLGIPGLTVSIFDSSNLSPILYECTDEIGYFKLEIPCKPDRSSTRKNKNQPHIAPAFLQVSGRDQTILYKSEESFVPECAKVTYQEIELEDEQASACMPPPSEG